MMYGGKDMVMIWMFDYGQMEVVKVYLIKAGCVSERVCLVYDGMCCDVMFMWSELSWVVYGMW